MRMDYHMHLEHGSYDVNWVEGFFATEQARGLDEIGFSEHSHGFAEFKPLYYHDLVLDDSFIGAFQQKWLQKHKFMYTLDDYFALIDKLRERGHVIKAGIEVCNFQQQDKVAAILTGRPFDYLIGSVHFLHGWAYDSVEIIDEWSRHSLREVYGWYAEAVEQLCASGTYDVLGHPFNIRLFKHIPDFDVSPYLDRVAKALKAADMVVDVNTGTRYRYPIAEISPYPDFMAVAADYHLPIITSSDAHEPTDCGRFLDEAIAYAKRFGYTQSVQFNRRDRKLVKLG